MADKFRRADLQVGEEAEEFDFSRIAVDQGSTVLRAAKYGAGERPYQS